MIIVAGNLRIAEGAGKHLVGRPSHALQGSALAELISMLAIFSKPTMTTQRTSWLIVGSTVSAFIVFIILVISNKSVVEARTEQPTEFAHFQSRGLLVMLPTLTSTDTDVDR